MLRCIRHSEKSTRQWRTFKTNIITYLGTTRKLITKRYRRAREPSRISLRFLRRLKNKSSMLKKSLFKRLKRISSILIPKSSKLHRFVKRVRKLYNTRYKCDHKHDPKIFYVIKVAVPKKTYLLSFSSLFYHTYMIMKLMCNCLQSTSIFIIVFL